MTAPAKPTPNSLVRAMLVVLDATVIVLSLATDFPVWVSVAVIAASVAGVAAWHFATRRRGLTTVLSASCAAALFAFAAEGVRGALTDTPATHRYFVVEEAFSKTAPDTSAGEAEANRGCCSPAVPSTSSVSRAAHGPSSTKEVGYPSAPYSLRSTPSPRQTADGPAASRN